MSSTTCDWESGLVAVALSALAPDEEHTIRVHAAGCPACDRALAEFEEAAALLGAAVVEIPPPLRLKRQVLRAARTCIPGRPNQWETHP